MIQSLTSKLYTVAALREIADRMSITVPSKATKLAIAELIVAGIDTDHAEAIQINNAIVSPERQAEIDMIDAEYWARYRAERRINNYIRQRGTDKLTAPQWRRIRKSLRKGNLALIDLNLYFV